MRGILIPHLKLYRLAALALSCFVFSQAHAANASCDLSPPLTMFDEYRSCQDMKAYRRDAAKNLIDGINTSNDLSLQSKLALINRQIDSAHQAEMNAGQICMNSSELDVQMPGMDALAMSYQKSSCETQRKDLGNAVAIAALKSAQHYQERNQEDVAVIKRALKKQNQAGQDYLKNFSIKDADDLAQKIQKHAYTAASSDNLVKQGYAAGDLVYPRLNANGTLKVNRRGYKYPRSKVFMQAKYMREFVGDGFLCDYFGKDSVYVFESLTDSQQEESCNSGHGNLGRALQELPKRKLIPELKRIAGMTDQQARVASYQKIEGEEFGITPYQAKTLLYFAAAENMTTGQRNTLARAMNLGVDMGQSKKSFQAKDVTFRNMMPSAGYHYGAKKSKSLIAFDDATLEKSENRAKDLVGQDCSVFVGSILKTLGYKIKGRITTASLLMEGSKLSTGPSALFEKVPLCSEQQLAVGDIVVRQGHVKVFSGMTAAGPQYVEAAGGVSRTVRTIVDDNVDPIQGCRQSKFSYCGKDKAPQGSHVYYVLKLKKAP